MVEGPGHGPGPGCRELVITINNRSADTLTPAHREADRGMYNGECNKGNSDMFSEGSEMTFCSIFA